MKLSEMIEQVRLVCRMRRLSRHTEQTYAAWITSPLDVMPSPENVVPFRVERAQKTVSGPVERRVA